MYTSDYCYVNTRQILSMIIIILERGCYIPKQFLYLKYGFAKSISFIQRKYIFFQNKVNYLSIEDTSQFILLRSLIYNYANKQCIISMKKIFFFYADLNHFLQICLQLLKTESKTFKKFNFKTKNIKYSKCPTCVHCNSFYMAECCTKSTFLSTFLTPKRKYLSKIS